MLNISLFIHGCIEREKDFPFKKVSSCFMSNSGVGAAAHNFSFEKSYYHAKREEK